ncbi:MAG TPA: orotate phosphoribosyltransferase [Planctomycetota bacterium]|jgi:orotate phosphoribosyltransferase|nr:orotate phosphoribosyltransferase [Myxococcales bacterium]HLU50070.1 orotate phosphoribosyltransferase [Planctomycetota bacterium]
MTQRDRDALLDLLRDRSFKRGKFVLTSGRESDFFIDCKPTVLTAEGHRLVGAVLLNAVEGLGQEVDAVAGVELGGCPLASAVSLTSALEGRPLDALYVRKAKKGHGTGRLVEGAERLPAGSKVVILEDTITTGGSTLRAVESLRSEGIDVAGVIAVVDRDEGGADAIREAGLPFVAIFTRRDFMGDE